MLYPSPPTHLVKHIDLNLHKLRFLIEATETDAATDIDVVDKRVRAFDMEIRVHATVATQRGDVLPDRAIARFYDLTAFEHQALWLAVAPYLDPDILSDAPTRPMTPARCLALLCPDREATLTHRLALQPGAPLYAHGLLTLVPRAYHDRNWLHHTLVPSEHIVALFTGQRRTSPELASFVTHVTPHPELANLQALAAAKEVVTALDGFGRLGPLHQQAWHSDAGVGLSPSIAALLTGAAGSGRTTLARAIGARLERDLLVLDGPRLASAAHSPDVDAALTRAFQEAELFGELIVIRDADAVVAPKAVLAPRLGARLDQRHVAALLCTQRGAEVDASVETAVLLRHTVSPPRHGHRVVPFWRASLPAGVQGIDARRYVHICNRYDLNPLQIRKATHLASLFAAAETDAADTADAAPAQDASPALVLTPERLEASVNAQVVSNMSGLAESRKVSKRLDQLVLDPDTMTEVRKIISAYRTRRTVLERWGLGRRIHRGTGILCLFNGDPGTGKTFSAEVIAAELGLELMHINVASIVDKYIGETEKNLERIFALARPDLNLLLFDEADSIFGKRTAVKQGNDRYANMEVNVLLQLIEQFTGIAVLTTNLKSGIDSAFGRRISFKVDFPLPGERERARIWRVLLPKYVPVAGAIDYTELALTELSGGAIKNAVLRAGYSAALQDRLIAMDDLLDAAHYEAASEGRLVRDHR